MTGSRDSLGCSSSVINDKGASQSSFNPSGLSRYSSEHDARTDDKVGSRWPETAYEAGQFPTIRTYCMDVPATAVEGPPTKPTPVHFAAQSTHRHHCAELCRRSALITVGLCEDGQTRSVSPASQVSGISVEEIATPPAVANAARKRPPGTYKVACVGHSIRFSPDARITKGQFDWNYAETAVHYTIMPAERYGEKIATTEHLAALEQHHPLPQVYNGGRWFRTRYLTFTFYRRLLLLVLLANICTICAMVARTNRTAGSFTYSQAATAVGANLLAGVLMRQEHVINVLFHLACALPCCTPLALRRFAAKMAYNNGGIHAGAGSSALLWYIYYTALLFTGFEGSRGEQVTIYTITALTLALFVVLICASHPWVRQRYHDAWELSHRYCGWTAVACVWAQTIISCVATSQRNKTSIGPILISTPTFWFMLVITACLIYPWLWLRRLPVEANQLSSHATELRFHNRQVPACVATRLAHQPFKENHGFATIANPDPEKGYSVVVSNAGDFTKKLIVDPPQYIWQRGAPTIGVMRLSSLFRPIVIVATGSGIGPATSFLNIYPNHPKRILWSARFPEQTYTRSFLANVFRVDEKAVVIDTKKTGQPNMSALTFALVQEIGAEAVMIISNPKVTKEVVYAMEARKIPAFGAIFDS